MKYVCASYVVTCDLSAPSNLVAVVEAHAAEGRQFGLQALVSRLLLLLLLVELLSLDLLPHAPGLLDGLHHCVLVPEQRCGVEAGQDVWEGRGWEKLDVTLAAITGKHKWFDHICLTIAWQHNFTAVIIL